VSLFFDDLNEELKDPEFAALFAEAQKLVRSTLEECP
jgi:hypothetical protein